MFCCCAILINNCTLFTQGSANSQWLLFPKLAILPPAVINIYFITNKLTPKEPQQKTISATNGSLFMKLLLILFTVTMTTAPLYQFNSKSANDWQIIDDRVM